MDKADWVKIIVLAVLALAVFVAGKRLGQRRAVSYTHLTLPTMSCV